MSARKMMMKQVAKALAEKGRSKIAKYENDEEELHRSTMDLMQQGDQHDVENPEEKEEQMALAKMLHEKEEMEMYSKGGVVEIPASHSEEPMKEEEKAKERIHAMDIPEDVLKAIHEKKMKRKFR